MIDHLGKYEILRSLGNGAMGEVFLAHHPVIGRDVAIKTILPGVAKGEDAEARFRREATAAGKLNHPNLVTIYDFDKDQGIFYLVMEYVKGDDLEDLIRDRGLSQSQFLEVLAQVCDGLGYAHRNGIIHRDIKPANVRVMRDGKRLQAKVMDFGIARVEDSNMTSTGIVMGTVSYMAPEYIQSGRASNLTDLFAVGVMLYEAITGTKPFAGENTTTVLFKIVTENPRPVDLEAIQGISPSVRDILDRALAKDPVRRYQTAEELAKALRACKDPSWSGTLEDLTSALDRKQSAAAPALTEGTTLLAPPTAGTPIMAPPTVMQPVGAEPTAVVPAPGRPAPGRPAPGSPATTVLQPAAAPAPRPSRTGLYAGIGVVVLAALGAGAWFGLRKPAPVQTGEPPASAPTPAQAVPAEPTQPQANPPQTAVPEPTGATPQGNPKTPQPKDAPKADPATQAAPTKVEPTVTRAPEESPEQKLARAEAVIVSNPRQAAAILRGLVSERPQDARVQGDYLAALYQGRQAAEFERAMGAAKANGVGTLKMMRESRAFSEACAQERAAQKARNGTSLWEPAAFIRLLAI